MEQYYGGINQVCIYLRKSRGEEENLDKHKLILTELAQEYGWKYQTYQEIGTSDSIVERKEFQKLLNDVQNDLYDAILVVDSDRLSRGDMEEQGYIQRVFRESNTKVITPTKIYDYNNEDQVLEIDLNSFFARFEYHMIKKRLHRGKKIGAKQGKFVNGRPPYPYYYDRAKKKVEIDQEKLKIYNLIKDKFFSGISPQEISIELNKNGIPSPGGVTWSNVAVYRLLTNEFHLGKVIYGKTEGSGHKNRKTKPLKKKPRDQWIVGEGNHTPIKTEEEHYKILSIIEKRKTYSKTARRGNRILSGILKCAICGRGASYYDRAGVESVKTCTYVSPLGEKCPNSGFKAKIVYKVLNKELDKYKEDLFNYNPQKNNKANEIQGIIEVKNEGLKRLEGSIGRLGEMFELGYIDKQKYLERCKKRTEEILSLKYEIEELNKSLIYYKRPSAEEHARKIMRFQDIFGNKDFSDKEKNDLAKEIIKEIRWLRKGTDVNFNIIFY